MALVAAAASLAVPSPAAYAAPCTGDSGVSVVVDFNGLGGGVQQVCVSGGGGDAASSLFPAAGFPLNYASRQPGFVCRVKGVPTSDPCVNTAPADAFWGLWWSDGDASSWTFSSLGAASLTIPDGGMVAFSWDAESGTAPPSASPSHPDPAPTPEPNQPPPNDGGGSGPDQPAAPGGSTPPGSTPSTSPDGSPSASPGAEDGKKGKGDKRERRQGQAEEAEGHTRRDADHPGDDRHRGRGRPGNSSGRSTGGLRRPARLGGAGADRRAVRGRRRGAARAAEAVRPVSPYP